MVWSFGLVARRIAPLALVAALLLHALLLAAGFERLSNDDSARVLMALELTPGNALEPWIWPPLHRIVLGLALNLHHDVVWVPRLLSVGLALLLLVALLLLARRISSDPLVALATALLALVSPYRLLLGSVPLADILMLPLLVLAAERVLAWLQGARAGALLAGCALVGAATAVRYEAWFVACTLGLTLAWRWWRGDRVSFGLLAAAGVLLCAFPVFWVVNSWAWHGSLENLAATPDQFQAIAGAEAVWQSLVLNPLGQPLWQELVWNPATALGAVMLALLAIRDRAARSFAAGFMVALPLMGAVMFATTAVSLAATWRLVGIWSLLLLPFGALALVRLAEACVARLRLHRGAALALLLVPALALPAVRDVRLIRTGMFNWETGTWRNDAAAGRAAVAELARLGAGRAVVDSLDNLDFLEVMVGSGAPERFVTSADAPPAEVALHVPMAAHLRAIGDTELVARYLDDRFALREGGDADALIRRRIRVALVRDPAAVAALDASPLAERVAAWPDWTLYRLLPGELAEAGG
jgi:hypothetical protein